MIPLFGKTTHPPHVWSAADVMARAVERQRQTHQAPEANQALRERRNANAPLGIITAASSEAQADADRTPPAAGTTRPASARRSWPPPQASNQQAGLRRSGPAHFHETAWRARANAAVDLRGRRLEPAAARAPLRPVR